MKERIALLLIILFIISIVLIKASSFQIFTAPVGLLQRIVTPIQSFFYSSRFISNSTNSEIKKLTEENKKLSQKIAELSELKKDNDALRSQFQISDIKSQDLMPAKVVGFVGSYNHPENLIIDKGKNDGVKENQSVIKDKNLVGVIAVTSGGISQVKLIENSSFVTTGVDLSTNAIGVVKGEDSFVLLDRVSITDSIHVGDLVATKGEVNNNGIGVQKDFIVGKITSINKSENQPFQNAKVEPLLDYSKLDSVFVIIPK